LGVRQLLQGKNGFPLALQNQCKCMTKVTLTIAMKTKKQLEVQVGSVDNLSSFE